MIVYNPLAGGFLTGKHRGYAARGHAVHAGSGRRALPRPVLARGPVRGGGAAPESFRPRGKALVTVAVAWVLAQPGITSAIVGASKPEQLDESLAAVHCTFDDQERELLNLAWYSLPRR